MGASRRAESSCRLACGGKHEGPAASGRGEISMIKAISIVTIHVSNQDDALKFYTEVLGFEKGWDAPMGDLRWLTVAPGPAWAFIQSKSFSRPLALTQTKSRSGE